MRRIRLFFGCGVIFLAAATTVSADYASVRALGNPVLVMEDETTALNLFNLGNPAGAAFRPKKNRLDLTVQGGQRVETEEFFTLPEPVVWGETGSYYTPPDENSPVDPNGTTTTTFYLFYNLDSEGNTLPTNALISRKRKQMSASLLSPADTLYQGWFTWLTDDLALQVIPFGQLRLVNTTDFSGLRELWQAGGALRGAYLLWPGAAVGAGVSGQTYFSRTDFEESEWDQFEIEAGLASRWQEVFNSDDHLDLGITARGGQKTEDLTLLDVNNVNYAWSGTVAKKLRPALAEVQGIYYYRSVMEIGLRFGYIYEDAILSWAGGEQLATALRNVDYDLQFRVRLPMIREDDLRFGVSFNNEGILHPYPTGILDTSDHVTLAPQQQILTSSSGIGIGTAFVPGEGSIIALEYRLGTSKSQQTGADENLADSGYTTFSVGAQFLVAEGLTLRGGYTDERLTYESLAERHVASSTQENGELITKTDPETFLLTESTNRRSYNLGIGIADGPISINLTATYAWITNSPTGWDFTDKDKPVGLRYVNKDENEEISGLLSFTWKY